MSAYVCSGTHRRDFSNASSSATRASVFLSFSLNSVTTLVDASDSVWRARSSRS